MKIAIGIDLDWPYEHHYDVLKGILDYGKKNNWDCRLEPWLEESDNFEEIDGVYDGIIARVNSSLAEWCKERKLPLVNVWVNSPVSDVPLVGTDVETAGTLVADYFISRGFQNFFFLADRNDHSAQFMLIGFEERLLRKGYSTGRGQIVKPTNKAGWKEHDQILEKIFKTIEIPVAVLADDHLTARYLCEWCKKQGLMVPDDVAIFSPWSNELICERLEPALSHILNRFDDVGYKAAESLALLINGRPAPKRVLLHPGNLVERRSTDVEPVCDRVIARALRFIRDYSAGPIQVTDVAGALGMTRRSLERKFKQSWVRSINEEILKSRLERAQKILANSDITVKKVAEKSGFSSSQRMAQVFRTHLGMSAKEYRESEK